MVIKCFQIKRNNCRSLFFGPLFWAKTRKWQCHAENLMMTHEEVIWKMILLNILHIFFKAAYS